MDGVYSDARHPDGVTFTRSLRQDAARRDFTINAMAYAPGWGLQDFFGGQADLAQGTIRAVGRAETRFHEDALRILRALRFASVLDFTLEAETHQAALAHLVDALGRVSPDLRDQYIARRGQNTAVLVIRPVHLTGKAKRDFRPIQQRM